MIRAFLAVELDAPLRDRLARLQHDLKQRLGRDLPRSVRVSWVAPASVHLTVRFLGDIDEQLVAPLQDAIDRLAGSHGTMRVPLDRLGVFPRPQQPRVLWVGPAEGWERSEEAARVADLHRTVESGCRSLGMAPDEKPLAPHLTLARIKAGEREMGRVLAGSGVMEGPTGLGTLALDSIVLMKSELRPTGSLYTKVWSVPLGK